MNLFHSIENFLMNRFGGKLVSRAAVAAAGALATWLSSEKAQAAIAVGLEKAAPLLDAVGVHVQVGPVNQIALTALISYLAHAAFELFKAKRAANPDSPTVQTDATKPNAGVVPAVPLQ